MHAELLAARVQGAKLAAVSDAVAGLAGDVGAALGVPAMETDRLLEGPSVMAVAICAPTAEHVPLIEQAAAGGKAIFCEKPVSLDLTEVDRALDATRSAGVPFMVGFNRRFDPSHAAVREAVASGAVGAPHLARVTSRDPEPPPLAYAKGSGGIFLDMTVHDFDMARFVVGSEVAEVYAAGAVRVAPPLAELGDVDTAVVVLRHVDGCLTTIDNSRKAVYGYDQRVEVLGSAGLAASDNPLVNTSVLRDAGGSKFPALHHFFIERYAESYRLQWEAFVRAVTSGSPPPTTGEDGRAALVLGLAAKKSLALGRAVAVTEVAKGVGL
jgi:myo-inositol 2-dehydrogenase/D-chiro-inositol 1-dehydrogenase